MNTAVQGITVLYDGWPLVRHPNSLAALHLWSLLIDPPKGFHPVVALPGNLPECLAGLSLRSLSVKVSNTSWGRLRWEQRILPSLAHRAGARILHTCTGFAPLFSKTPVVDSSADFQLRLPLDSPTLSERMRRALGIGGLSRAATLIRPNDLQFESTKNVTLVEPFSSSSFLWEVSLEQSASQNLGQMDLNIPFVLYHGSGDLKSLHRLFSAWSWVKFGQVPLVLVGLSHLPEGLIPHLMLQYELMDTVIQLPDQPPAVIARLYQNCTALFHPGELTPWGEPVRSAMNFGKPVAAAFTPQTAALVGPAAYLAPLDDSRLLGAAILSILVDTALADQLSLAAESRSVGWRGVLPSRMLGVAYQNALVKL